MTAREPSAVEVIASPIVGWQVGGGGFDWASVDRDTALSMADAAVAALKAAGYVVATPEEIRAWPVERQAELIGGVVRRLSGGTPDEFGLIVEEVSYRIERDVQP